jgi:hypothetical protein
MKVSEAFLSPYNMNKDDLINGNVIIADFLSWKQHQSDDGIITYDVPNRFQEDTGTTEWDVEEFEFDNDWNWLLHAWDTLHRKVLIPILKDNPHLRREVNELIKDMRSSLKWVHIEGSYKTLVRIILWYNHQLK